MFGPRMIQTPLKRYAKQTLKKKSYSHNLNLQNDPRETTGSTNIFDDLPSLKPSEDKEPQDELERFLSTERDLNVKDGLRWWVDRKHLYPRLSRMALDYLSIPGKLYSLFAIYFSLIIITSHISRCRTNIQPGPALTLTCPQSLIHSINMRRSVRRSMEFIGLH